MSDPVRVAGARAWWNDDYNRRRNKRMASKDKPPQGKNPNTGSNTSQKRDDKMSTTDKSRDPNRPHVDK